MRGTALINVVPMLRSLSRRVNGHIQRGTLPAARYVSATTSFSLPLDFINSPYNSATLEISTGTNTITANDFQSRLARCVSVLKEQQKTAAYIKIDMRHADLIPIAGSLGFRYHNAEGSQATLLLWLRDDVCKVPVFATHHCGVGGLVLNGERILVIREHGKDSKWKLPGGLADLGENIEEAIEREVMEETGIKAQFQSILTMRHAHKVQFGRSDLYFTCLLTALSDDIRIDAEIQDAMWMSPEQLQLECPFPTVLTALELLRSNRLDDSFTGREYKHYYANRLPYQLYATKNLEQWVPNYIHGLPPAS